MCAYVCVFCVCAPIRVHAYVFLCYPLPSLFAMQSHTDASYTPPTRLLHASYTPLTRLLHAFYTPLPSLFAVQSHGKYRLAREKKRKGSVNLPFQTLSRFRLWFRLMV
jgi:hypothetical protein